MVRMRVSWGNESTSPGLVAERLMLGRVSSVLGLLLGLHLGLLLGQVCPEPFSDTERGDRGE